MTSEYLDGKCEKCGDEFHRMPLQDNNLCMRCW